MRPDIGRTILAGFVATVVLTGIMYWVAPLMMGQPMDVAGMLSGLIGVSWGAGMILHFTLGTLVFPLTYALVLYPVLPGGPWLKGVWLGLGLWLVAEAVVVPMAGGGFFHARMGGAMAAFGGLLGHLVYGALVGGIAGAARRRATDYPHGAPA